MSNSFKPRFNGPTLSVVRPKQYDLYNETDVDTFNKLKEMNDQIDALKLENATLKLENEQLIHCCKGQGAGMNAQIDALKLENATLKLENEQLIHCCKGQGAGSRRFRKHMHVRKGTASRRRHKNRK